MRGVHLRPKPVARPSDATRPRNGSPKFTSRASLHSHEHLGAVAAAEKDPLGLFSEQSGTAAAAAGGGDLMQSAIAIGEFGSTPAALLGQLAAAAVAAKRTQRAAKGRVVIAAAGGATKTGGLSVGGSSPGGRAQPGVKRAVV